MKDGLNIGALSRLTGIPADTLRTWERRYGFPEAERTSSGHRRYSSQTAERLLLVRQLLRLGFKPSTILGWPTHRLQQEVENCERSAPPATSLVDDAAFHNQEADLLNRWIDLARNFDGISLERELALTWDNFGAAYVIEHVYAPFLRKVGIAWSEGLIDIRHEHFITERFEHFLARKWIPLSDQATFPKVVCATPAGEMHGLGLHLASVVMALAGARLVFLGPNAPAHSIVMAAADQGVQGIALSVSTLYSPRQLELELAEIQRLAPDMPILVGGRGAINAPPGVVSADQLSRAGQWIQELRM